MIRKRLCTAAFLLLASCLHAYAANDAPQTTHYTGTIQGDLKVVVTLTNTHNVLDGSYLYARHGQPITLKGGRDGKNISLTESTDDGKLPGTFELADGPNGTLIGAWKNAGGKKSLAVELTPVAKTITMQTEVKGLYTIQSNFLHFEPNSPFHTALNQAIEADITTLHNAGVKELRELAADQMKAPGETSLLPYTQKQWPTLFYADDSLISIRYLIGEYTGGAHSNYTFDVRNYQWKNNKLVKLETSQLVTATTPALKTLRDLCVKELKNQRASWPEDAKFTPRELPTLNFTADALIVSFGPYDVGPYAEGPHTVALPWASVQGVLGDKSALTGLGH